MTQGVDLSYCQPKVDFKQLKALGYDFVILRAGYGNAIKYPGQFDPTFESHYAAAKAAGLNVGAYWYSYAESVEAVKQEAAAFIKAAKGKVFEFPLFFDLEEKKQFDKGVTFCNSIITAFCQEIDKAGYYAGVYCSTFWYTNYVSKSVREKWPLWIAEYNSACNYKGKYTMWQNGTVYVPGVGEIDHDFCYVDYPSIIKAAGKNGLSATAPKKKENAPAAPAKKSVDEIALEVIRGDWGAGATRKKKLTAAGYDYAAVQKRVNELMKQSAPAKKSVDEIALEVIRGDWGAGATRKNKLTAAGYDYAAVQKRVNEMLKK